MSSIILASVHFAAAEAGEPWRKSLHDGFNGQDFTSAGGLYYRNNHEQAAGTIEFQDEVKLEGKGALKLTVRELCPAMDELCSERAEIWEKTKLRVPYEQGVWFGFATKFDDMVPQDDHRYLIAQWKREIGPEAEGDFSPFLAVRLNKGKLFITTETNFRPGLAVKPVDGKCPGDATPVWLRPETDQMRTLIATDPTWDRTDGEEFASCTDQVRVIHHADLPKPQSGWLDFAVYSRPGPKGNGHIEIFVNGVAIATIEGFIGHDDHGLGKNQYFKFGPYRAGTKGLWTMYYDDFRRSLKCMEVLRDARSCKNFRP